MSITLMPTWPSRVTWELQGMLQKINISLQLNLNQEMNISGSQSEDIS